MGLMSWSPLQPSVDMVMINTTSCFYLINTFLKWRNFSYDSGTVQHALKITSPSVPMTTFEGDSFIILIFLMK